MTWKERQAASQCGYQGECDRPLLDGKNYCRLHWAYHCDLKRYHWTYRRHYRRPKQLELSL